jgi:acyl-coenzyme A thioesterase PaaI-like protein
MKPDFLNTTKKESFKSWSFRVLMNWYPMYFGTGGKVLFWAGDSSEVHLRLRLNLWTYNAVGTIFGGSLFSAADPFYMVMLLRSLGPAYVVWDKTAHIRFKRPGKGKLYARLLITPDDLQNIRQQVQDCGHATKTFVIQWMDKDQTVYAEIERQVYIADKEFYQKKKGLTQTSKF